VEFVVDKAAVGQVFSEYFSFLFHSCYQLLHTHQHSSSRTGKIGTIVADVPSGFSLQLKVKKKVLPLSTRPHFTTQKLVALYKIIHNFMSYIQKLIPWVVGNTM
jgi:hypothetical protein